MTSDPDLLALFPAAGRATRLPAAEGSKEVLPIALGPRHGPSRLVCQDLLDAYGAVRPTGLLVLTRRAKPDVPHRLAALTLPYPVVHLMVGETPSIVHTLDAA